jgi:5'(3')-deoxyribonucleotidase
MNIFIDIDGVLWNTAKKIVELYNKKYNHNGKWEDADEWNFSPAVPVGTKDEVIDELFESNEIYEGDATVEGAVEYINKLNEEFSDVYFCTVGKNINNSQKLKMLKRLIPEVKVITISFPGEVFTDKSMINMDGAVFIDDHSSNLESTNAKYKILFEPYGPKKWNTNWEGIRLHSWSEVYHFIKTLHHIEKITDEKYLKLINCTNETEIASVLKEIIENAM